VRLNQIQRRVAGNAGFVGWFDTRRSTNQPMALSSVGGQKPVFWAE